MIWRVRKPYVKNRAKYQWHDWFAWYPVRVPTRGRMSKQHKVWLTKIRRKGEIERGGWGDSWRVWHYALKGQEYDIKQKNIGGYQPKQKNIGGYQPKPALTEGKMRSQLKAPSGSKKPIGPPPPAGG